MEFIKQTLDAIATSSKDELNAKIDTFFAFIDCCKGLEKQIMN